MAKRTRDDVYMELYGMTEAQWRGYYNVALTGADGKATRAAFHELEDLLGFIDTATGFENPALAEFIKHRIRRAQRMLDATF